MPVYTYRCPRCGDTRTAHRTIEYRDDGPQCDSFDCRSLDEPGSMIRVPDAPMGIVNGPAVPRGS